MQAMTLEKLKAMGTFAARFAFNNTDTDLMALYMRGPKDLAGRFGVKGVVGSSDPALWLVEFDDGSVGIAGEHSEGFTGVVMADDVNWGWVTEMVAEGLAASQ